MIEFDALTKVYAGRPAVEELSFTAPAGAVTGFLGPNGSGKTTTLRCLLGLAEPTSGAALINGRRYAEIDSPRRQVGAMLESTGFHPNRTGRDHLRVIARAATVDAGRIARVLDVVGLSRAADRCVGGYSLGMRQRLGLATAFLGEPAVIVLVEPVNGLDPEGVTWVRHLLRQWATEGRTVLVASHLLTEVGQVADRVVIVRDGRLVRAAEIGDLVRPRVIVRVDRPEPMMRVLAAAGAVASVLGDGAIAVDGMHTMEVGRLAASAAVVVSELTTTGVGETLEATFLALTGTATSGVTALDDALAARGSQ